MGYGMMICLCGFWGILGGSKQGNAVGYLAGGEGFVHTLFVFMPIVGT